MSSYQEWSVEEACTWLGVIGLEDLSPLFQAQGVNGSALEVLTKEDLQAELGIERYMHRRVMWKELLRLRGKGKGLTLDLPSCNVQGDLEAGGSPLSLSSSVSTMSSSTVTTISSPDIDWKIRKRLTPASALTGAPQDTHAMLLSLGKASSLTPAALCTALKNIPNGIQKFIQRLLTLLAPSYNPCITTLSPSTVTLFRAYKIPIGGEPSLQDISEQLAQDANKTAFVNLLFDTLKLCDGIDVKGRSHSLDAQAAADFVGIFLLAEDLKAAHQSRADAFKQRSHKLKGSAGLTELDGSIGLTELHGYVVLSPEMCSSVLREFLLRCKSPTDPISIPVLKRLASYGVTPGPGIGVDTCSEQIRTGKYLKKFLADVLKILKLTKKEVQDMTGRTRVCMGDDVVVSCGEDEVKRCCEEDKGLGWDVNMAAYIGQQARVKKTFPPAFNRVQLVHESGATWTWPTSVVCRIQSAPPQVLSLGCLASPSVRLRPVLGSPVLYPISNTTTTKDLHFVERKGDWHRLLGGGWARKLPSDSENTIPSHTDPSPPKAMASHASDSNDSDSSLDV